MPLGLRCVWAALAAFISVCVVTYGDLSTIGWVWFTGLVTGYIIAVLLMAKPKMFGN